MTVQFDTDDDQAAPEPQQRPGLARRMLNAYLYGNTIVVIALSFICALVFGALLIAISDEPTRQALGYFGQQPSDTFSRAWHAISAGYSALFRGSVLNTNSLYSDSGVPVFRPISDTLVNAAPLILGGLSVAVAFRAGLFNIGVQGQLIMGAIAAGYVGFAWNLPAGVHLIVALIAGIIGGGGLGRPGRLPQGKTGAHEVITTIMLNYVAYYFLGYLLGLHGFQKPNSHRGDLAHGPFQRAAAAPVRRPALRA